MIRSARLPASSEPIESVQAEHPAPRRWSPSRAPCGARPPSGRRLSSLCSNAAWRIASNMSRSLLLAAPSVPDADGEARGQHGGHRSGAAGQLHVALRVVRDADAVPAGAAAISSARDPDAVRRDDPRAEEADRRRDTGTASAPCCSRASATSSSVSETWISSGAPIPVGEPARRPSSHSRSSVYIECGATAGHDEVVTAEPLQERLGRAAAPSAGVFASATGNPMIVSPSTPRSPASFAARATSSSK